MANVKFLKAAGFSACEFERSENEQVEKPADFQEYVCASHGRGAHFVSSFLNTNMQIKTNKTTKCASLFFQRVKVPYARGRIRSISKWQAGCG